MRYFVQLSYNGSNYAGWQSQPNSPTIQNTLEEAFSKLLQTSIKIVGCGRTDSAVHAKNYVAHLDYSQNLDAEFIKKINRYLPNSIIIHNIYSMHPEAHARFDAIDRSYRYTICKFKDPFNPDTKTHDPFFDKLDIYQLNECAGLLLNYTEFLPFCKTNSDVEHYKCHLTKSQWSYSQNRDHLWYEVQSNRFLRGMVRLIVGCCRQVCLGKISIEQVNQALEKQSSMPKAYSAPASGLFLMEVAYPEGYFDNKVI